MGHEIAGDIVLVGEEVENVKAGDRVAVYFYLACGIADGGVVVERRFAKTLEATSAFIAMADSPSLSVCRPKII